MKLKKYIKEKGWQTSCAPKPCRAMKVDVGFVADGEMQETQFEIRAYDADELEELFSEFCKENVFPQNTVCSVTIVEFGETREGLL